jgi:plasmid replication initiation protein
MSKQTQIKKHVASIHCSNSVSLLERRVFNALILNTQSHDQLEGAFFYISLSRLKELLRFQSRNNSALRDAVIGLTETTVKWNLCKDRSTMGANWFSASLLASASYSNGIIRYEYSKAIMDLVKDPCVYANICLDAQARLNSKYSLALYENCIRYKSLGSTKAFPVNLLRELLGADFGCYKKNSVLCQKIIKPAIMEINKKTNLVLCSRFIKQGNKIKAVKISVKTTIKTTTSPLIEKNNQEETQVFNALQKTDKSILKMLEESFLKKGANFHKKYTVNILKKGGGFKNPILLDSSSGGGLSFLKNVHPDLFFKLSN